MAIPGAPEGSWIEALSSGEPIALRRADDTVGIRMPEGAGFGLRAVPIPVEGPTGFGWIGNPQLVLRVPLVAAVDLAVFAPPLRHHPAIAGGTNVNVVEELVNMISTQRAFEINSKSIRVSDEMLQRLTQI